MTAPRDFDATGVLQSDDRGPAIQVRSGRAFHVSTPRPGDPLLDDMAHALAFLCRYNGHTARFYSVIEHLIHCCDLYLRRRGFTGYVDPLLRFRRREAWIALTILGHDTAEAYVGDMTRPTKQAVPAFREVEGGVQRAICLGHGLIPEAEWPAEVQEFDNLVLAAERRDLMAGGPAWPGMPAPPDDLTLQHDDPTAAVLRELVALGQRERGPEDHPLQAIDAAHARMIVELAGRALAIHPETLRHAWNRRWETLWRASRPRPCGASEAPAIAALWAVQARSRGIDPAPVLAAVATDPAAVVELGTGTPYELASALLAWVEGSQKLYDACAATVAARDEVVRVAVAKWVGMGCAPELAPGQRVRAQNSTAEFVVGEWDARHALARVTYAGPPRLRQQVDPAGLLDPVAAEEFVPCP